MFKEGGDSLGRGGHGEIATRVALRVGTALTTEALERLRSRTLYENPFST